MNRSIRLWQLFGFGVTALCGTLLHFLYDWLGEACAENILCVNGFHLIHHLRWSPFPRGEGLESGSASPPR